MAFQEAIGCKVKKAFLRRTEEEGFISVWRLKTPSEACFRAGSCFLLELKDGDLQRLKGLQKTGLGMHTHLGLGRFVLGLQQETDKITIRDSEKRTFIRPISKMPEETMQLIKEIIKTFHPLTHQATYSDCRFVGFTERPLSETSGYGRH